MGDKKALLKREAVEICDILTINIIRFLQSRNELKEYDLAIHFTVPTIKLKKAINILFFQQFYEWKKHDVKQHLKDFDYVMTPAKAVTDLYKNVIYFH